MCKTRKDDAVAALFLWDIFNFVYGGNRLESILKKMVVTHYFNGDAICFWSNC